MRCEVIPTAPRWPKPKLRRSPSVHESDAPLDPLRTAWLPRVNRCPARGGRTLDLFRCRQYGSPPVDVGVRDPQSAELRPAHAMFQCALSHFSTKGKGIFGSATTSSRRMARLHATKNILRNLLVSSRASVSFAFVHGIRPLASPTTATMGNSNPWNHAWWLP